MHLDGIIALKVTVTGRKVCNDFRSIRSEGAAPKPVTPNFLEYFQNFENILCIIILLNSHILLLHYYYRYICLTAPSPGQPG